MRVLIVCIALLLAGCVTNEEPGLELALEGVPETAAAGEPITFEMTGTGDLTSGHVGAHFWSAATNDPTGDFDDAGGCVHVAGGASFPATVEVTCTFEDDGMVYLRGHVRSDDNVDNYWSDEHVIHVRSYDLSTSADDTTQAAVGADVEFTLTIEGDADKSGHIGAHYWTDDVEDPTASFADQAGGCAHVPGEQDVPGTFTVTCTFDEAGTYYVFGHMRLGTQANFWADSFQVVVA